MQCWARVLGLVASVCLCCSLLVSGEPTPKPQQASAPAIQVTTRLVQIDVIVRDKNGPVANLTKDDFSVFDRGKQQKISFFSLDSAKDSAQSEPEPLPQNTFSDLPQYAAGAVGSITIVLLDNLNTLYGSAPAGAYESTPAWMEDFALANGKAHLIQFAKNLNPKDRVAIYGLRQSLHVLCDFTCNRAQLLAILQKYDTTPLTSRDIAEPGATHTPVPDPRFDKKVDSERLDKAGSANMDRAGITMAALRHRRPRNQHSRTKESRLAHRESSLFRRCLGEHLEPGADCRLSDRRARSLAPLDRVGRNGG